MVFYVGDKVFAKVRSFPYWPVIIERIDNSSSRITKYEVLFCRLKKKATVSKNYICAYEEYKETHGKLKIEDFKNKMFNVAVNEVESYNGFNRTTVSTVVPEILIPKIEIAHTKPNTSIHA